MLSNKRFCASVICLMVFYISSAELKGCAKSISCTGLKKCRTYMSYIKAQSKPLHPSLVRFLKVNQCGFEGGFPKVCCGQIPKTLEKAGLLKNGTQRIKQNNLSVIQNETEELPRTTARPKNSKKIPQDLILDFPHFYITDYMEPLDFFRRKRGHVHSKHILNVEIR